MATPAGPQPDSKVKLSKKPMLSLGASEKASTLGRLLAAGGSHSMPIDMEAVDKLMRNFPIMEEHQVRCSGVDFLKLYIITFQENRFSQKTFPYQI